MSSVSIEGVHALVQLMITILFEHGTSSGHEQGATVCGVQRTERAYSNKMAFDNQLSNQMF